MTPIDLRRASFIVPAACVAIAISSPVTASAAASAGYPAKPVRIIVGAAPGGGTDNVVRGIAPRLTQILGQQIIIDNRVGAAGSIAARLGAQAAPDGYTLMATYATHATNLAVMKNPGYDLEREFTPISLTVVLPNMLACHPSLPVRDVKGLIALSAKRPGQIEYASGSYGGSAHLIMELFLGMTKTKMLNVPYKGFAPAVTAAIAGEVPVILGSVVTVHPQVRAGRLRALGVTNAKRIAAAPDIPAIAESVPGYEADNWSGLLAPAGTPKDIVAKLHAAVVETLKSPEVAKRFALEGGEPMPSRTPEEFGAMIRSEVRKWAAVVKDAGIHLE
ncbi:MAG TPA: tripartite tricarboxylate transporter substrate binding protein [Burkholderiales bacterium]|nr:tripartite tricarboxylate transporter substrate binding protein [Burkholderiales bacterium]